VSTQQATEVLRLQLRPRRYLPKSCGRAQELVIHQIPARKGAESELDVACIQRAEDGSRCRDVLRERPNAHAPRDGQDPGVVARSVDRSASVRRCVGAASKSDSTWPIRPLCKRHGIGYVRSCAKANGTSEGPGSQGCVPWVSWALRTEPPTGRRRGSVEYRLPPQCGLRRAINRSIHLDAYNGPWVYISRPEHQ
jgi:hypothetical protein